ncbi:hypothetical protein [Adhaeribacter arboris]|uniref:hypothetical protein n=1 Tax=Adhaeribacter arboris TaxID=2072846 RepID=UPI0011B25F14|nr:hypothetical protein [Adhaeribacter arboris]
MPGIKPSAAVVVIIFDPCSIPVMGIYSGCRSRSEMGGDKTEAGIGDMDYWVVKLKADGTKEWDKTIGSSGLMIFDPCSRRVTAAIFWAVFPFPGLAAIKPKFER